MAMLIEVYGTEGAIALAEKYSYNFVALLLSQTGELRKDPKERQQEAFEDWLEENKDRGIQFATGDGMRKINLKDFVPVA